MDNNERRRIQREIKELLHPSSKAVQHENSPLALHSFYITAVAGLFIVGTILVANTGINQNNTRVTVAPENEISNSEFEPFYYVNGTAIAATAMNYNDIPDIEIELIGI